MSRVWPLFFAFWGALALGGGCRHGNTGPACGDIQCAASERCCDHCLDSCVDATAGVACADDTDPGRACVASDAGSGTVCGGTTCEPGQVCCIDCDGNGLCGPPGTGCPGLACIPPDSGTSDAGSTDSGTGVACGTTTCTLAQACCIDCDGSGVCVAPGAPCPGVACMMPCAPGTCRLEPSGSCQEPTGPVGNGCCACSGGLCSAFCECAAPDTMVATPSGERAITDLVEGDLVYSVDGAAIVPVPVIAVRRSIVREDHVVMRVTLDNGAVIEMSPRHPTADGRRFGDLAAGGVLDGHRIVAAQLVPYGRPATYDILPGSDTGSYFAAGARVGSTLAPRAHPY